MSLARNIANLPNGDDAPLFGCRALINFNGTGTIAIRDSANVTSLSDNATGKYTITFDKAMKDANYVVVCGNTYNRMAHTQQNDSSYTRSTTQCQVGSNSSGGYFDPPYMEISIFQ